MCAVARACLGANNDVVDRNVDQLDEEANEAHDEETDRRRLCDFLVLCVFHELRGKNFRPKKRLRKRRANRPMCAAKTAQTTYGGLV